MLRVVLDANVYVSAVLRPEGTPGRIIGRFLRDAAFEIVLSPPIVEEVLRALTYPKVRKLIRSDIDPDLWFEDIVVLASVVTGEREQRAHHCTIRSSPTWLAISWKAALSWPESLA